MPFLVSFTDPPEGRERKFIRLGRAGGQAHLSGHLSSLLAPPLPSPSILSTCKGRSVPVTLLRITKAVTLLSPWSPGEDPTREEGQGFPQKLLLSLLPERHPQPPEAARPDPRNKAFSM